MTTPHGIAQPTAPTQATDPKLGSDAPPRLSLASPRGATYASGTVIASKYRLRHPLGEGGMGTVWLARNQSLDVDVALKLIRAGVSSALARARLLREARTAARLAHPSIVRVFDFGETDHGDPYIVMEVVRGDSLADILDRKGSLAAADAVKVLLPVGAALTAAHARGIVHRDIKPENIIMAVDERGGITPKLVDFGIAKVRTEADVKRPLTVDGAVLGSPDYMSPEQARGASDLDERADIWSFCVVLYEAICGPRPFEGSNYGALISAILMESPRSTIDRGVGDEPLWQIIERGLEKRRDDRWPSMRVLCRALAQWATTHGLTTDVTGAALSQHWTSEHVTGLCSAAPSGAARPPLETIESRTEIPTLPYASGTRTPALATVAIVAALAAGAAWLGAGSDELTAPASAGLPSDVPLAPAQEKPEETIDRVDDAPAPTTSAATSAKPRPRRRPRARRPVPATPVPPAPAPRPVDTSGIKEPTF